MRALLKTLKKIAKIFLALAMVASVTAAFFGAPTEWACRLQPAPTLIFLIVLLLTPFVGRLFCECLCPLGILQTCLAHLAHPVRAVRRVCTRLPESRAQRVTRYTILAIFATLIATGFGALAYFITPYALYGKALSLFYPGLALFALVMILACVGKGRIWCNWICPVGTLFTLFAKKSICTHAIAKRCKHCQACFAKNEIAKNEKIRETEKIRDDADDGLTRRETLKGAALFATVKIVEKTTDGGYAPVSLPGIPARPAPVLPPGAVDRELFAKMCVTCGLCITNCPGDCLRGATKLSRLGQPEMDFRHGYCLTGCEHVCATVCPTHAIRPLDGISRRDVHMGHAIWKKDLCVRTTIGDNCTACVRKCPVQAIHLVENFPVIDKRVCIGCGACEHVCPSRPMPAIFVKGFERQRIVTPMNEQSLIDEMKSRLTDGAITCVVAKNGVIVAEDGGRGVQPLLKMLDTNQLADALVVDKVIGRAAAAICIVGKAKRVHACVASEDALLLLREHHILATTDCVTTQILNRTRKAGCPLEGKVRDCQTPEKMVEALRTK